MMDGQIAAIRAALDEEGFTKTLLISYSTKFASTMYGPFRDAENSAPSQGDRQGYQASYRDLDTLAQTIQVTGLHKTIANHPGEYELDVFDPLTAAELEQAMSNVVIAYDKAYHDRLQDPSRWSAESLALRPVIQVAAPSDSK